LFNGGEGEVVISDIYRFVFVHVPKTAGVSITTALAREGSERHRLCLRGTKHETMKAFLDRVGPGKIEGYHRFSVVRHPVNRLCSHFWYLKSNPKKFPEIKPILCVEDYVDAIERDDWSIIRKKERVMPQKQYLYDGEKLIVDTVLRYEDISSSFACLCNEIGLRPRQLSKMNVSSRKDVGISDRVRSFADAYYACDFAAFGY
jgi:hypothetical protein